MASLQTGATRLVELAESTGRTLDSVWQEVYGSEAVKSVGGVWESAVAKLNVTEVLGSKQVLSALGLIVRVYGSGT